MPSWEYPEVGPDFAVARCTDLNLLLWLSTQVDPRAELAFARFVELTENDVLSYFVKRVGSCVDDAYDLRQDTYLEVYTHRRECRPYMARPFLFLKSANVLSRWHKRRTRTPKTLTDELITNEMDGRAVGNDLSVNARLDLEQARGRLTAEQNELISLHVDAGLGVIEIARQLGIPKQTVSRRLQHALNDLRRYLNDWNES